MTAMNLHDLTEPVRAILEGAGLTNDGRAWYFCEPGFSVRIMLDQHAAIRIAESILAGHLQNNAGPDGLPMILEMWQRRTNFYAELFRQDSEGQTLIRTGRGDSRLEALIAASAALAKEGG